MTTGKRFKVALSFPGEKRDFVEQVAHLLAHEFGKSRVFYDNYHVSELAKPNLDIHLMNLYKDHSDLIVPFLCEDYTIKEWCGLEMRSIREMIKHKRDDEIMPFRFDNTTVPGFLTIDGYIAIEGRTPEDVCHLILERLMLNDDAKPKVTGDINDLQVLQQKIDQLSQKFDGQLTTPELKQQLAQLTVERDLLREQLSRTEEIAEKNKKIKEELEQSLSKQKETEDLKKKAFEAVEEKDYDKAEAFLEEATRERKQQVAEDFYQLGNVKELKLEYRAALENYKTATKISSKTRRYIEKLAHLSKQLGYYNESIAYYNELIKLLPHKDGTQKELADVYTWLGECWQEKGQYTKALELLELGLSIIREEFGDNHLDISSLHNNIGMILNKMGAYDDAKAIILKSIDIALMHLDEYDVVLGIRYNNLASVYLGLKEYNLAVEYFEKTLYIYKRHYPENDLNLATICNNMGSAYLNVQDFSRAIQYYEEGLKILNKHYGETHPYIATSHNNIGEVWRIVGGYDNAIVSFKKAVTIVKVYHDDHPSLGTYYNNLALTYQAMAKYDDAIDYFTKSLAYLQTFYADTHPYIIWAKIGLETCVIAKGEQAKS